MAYTLQLLRELIAAHPDRAERLIAHVDALEASIEAQPSFCLQHVRTLFEAAHATIAPRLGIDFDKDDSFAARNKKLIKAMDFSVPGHPEEAKIADVLARLMGSINGTAAALGELSNIPNLRHGGSLDWSTLSRQHALMLGGLCDTLVAFLFDVAWSRGDESGELPIERYEENGDWNEVLDEEWGSLTIGNSKFWASRILYALDVTQYDLLRQEWLSDNREQPDAEADAA
jgi:hypothetical protein